MRQSVRALGWAVTLSMLLVFAFLVTAIYSMVQTMIESQGIGLGEVRGEISDNILILSVPLTLNNTGYYDISNFNVTMVLKGPNGTIISNKTTILELVKHGSTATALNNLTIDMAELISNMGYLLFSDAEFKMDVLLSFRYAYAITFQVSAANISIPWGAPLYNFSMTGVGAPYNISLTECLIDVYFGFENHSPFSVDGTLRLEIYNNKGEHIGSGVRTLNVPPGQGFSDPVTVHIENWSKYTGAGYIEISFESPTLGILDLGRVEYG